MFKYDFQKKDFLYGGIITAIIGLIALVLALIGINTGAFDPLGQALENFHLSDGFFYFLNTQAKKNNATPDANPGVVLVDIKDCDSREEIADIINLIKEASPRLLAVDIIMGEAASVTSEGDSALISALTGWEPEKLLLAQRMIEGPEEGRIERSFFADNLVCLEGDVGFNNGTVRSFAPSESFMGKEYPTFIAQIAKYGGIKEVFKEQLINYLPVTTIRLSPDELPANDFLYDQIVILGDSQDLRDFHSIPVLMDGQARTSGMNIIAQSLYTLRPHNGYTDCPRWLALIIGILLTYLFCVFIASPMFRIEHFNGLWISIWQITALVFLIGLTYILFKWVHFYMTLTYWLIGVGLSELATELFYFFKKKSQR